MRGFREVERFMQQGGRGRHRGGDDDDEDDELNIDDVAAHMAMRDNDHSEDENEDGSSSDTERESNDEDDDEDEDEEENIRFPDKSRRSQMHEVLTSLLEEPTLTQHVRRLQNRCEELKAEMEKMRLVIANRVALEEQRREEEEKKELLHEQGKEKEEKEENVKSKKARKKRNNRRGGGGGGAGDMWKQAATPKKKKNPSASFSAEEKKEDPGAKYADHLKMTLQLREYHTFEVLEARYLLKKLLVKYKKKDLRLRALIQLHLTLVIGATRIALPFHVLGKKVSRSIVDLLVQSPICKCVDISSTEKSVKNDPVFCELSRRLLTEGKALKQLAVGLMEHSENFGNYEWLPANGVLSVEDLAIGSLCMEGLWSRVSNFRNVKKLHVHFSEGVPSVFSSFVSCLLALPVVEELYVRISFTMSPQSSANLAGIFKARALKTLKLEEFFDKTFFRAICSPCPSLTTLKLVMPMNFSARFLEFCPNLERLKMTNVDLSRGVCLELRKHFANMSKLKSLKLMECELSSEDLLAHAFEAAKSVREVKTDAYDRISEYTAVALVNRDTPIESISLTGTASARKDAVLLTFTAQLVFARGLRKIQLREIRIDAGTPQEMFCAALQAMPQVECVKLSVIEVRKKKVVAGLLKALRGVRRIALGDITLEGKTNVIDLAPLLLDNHRIVSLKLRGFTCEANISGLLDACSSLRSLKLSGVIAASAAAPSEEWGGGFAFGNANSKEPGIYKENAELNEEPQRVLDIHEEGNERRGGYGNDQPRRTRRGAALIHITTALRLEWLFMSAPLGMTATDIPSLIGPWLRRFTLQGLTVKAQELQHIAIAINKSRIERICLHIDRSSSVLFPLLMLGNYRLIALDNCDPVITQYIVTRNRALREVCRASVLRLIAIRKLRRQQCGVVGQVPLPVVVDIARHLFETRGDKVWCPEVYAATDKQHVEMMRSKADAMFNAVFAVGNEERNREDVAWKRPFNFDF